MKHRPLYFNPDITHAALLMCFFFLLSYVCADTEIYKLSPQSSLSSRPPPADVKLGTLSIFPIQGDTLEKIKKENPRNTQIESMIRYLSFNIKHLIKAKEENKRHIYANMATVLRFWAEGNIILNMPSKKDLDLNEETFFTESDYQLDKMVIANVGKDPVVNYYAEIFMKMISERSLDEEMVAYMTQMATIPDSSGFMETMALKNEHNETILDHDGNPVQVTLPLASNTSTVTGMNLGYSLSDINTSYGHHIGDFFISHTGSFFNDVFGKSPTVKFHKYQRSHWVIYNLDTKPSQDVTKEAHVYFRFPKWNWTEPKKELDNLSILEFLYLNGYESLKKKFATQKNFPHIMQELLARAGIFIHKTILSDVNYAHFSYDQIQSGNTLTRISPENILKLLDHHFQNTMEDLANRTDLYVKKEVHKQQEKGIVLPLSQINGPPFSTDVLKSKIKLYSATRSNNSTFTRLTRILDVYHTYPDFSKTHAGIRQNLHRLFVDTINEEIEFLEGKALELKNQFDTLALEFFKLSPDDYESKKQIEIKMHGLAQRRKYIQERVINDIMQKLKDHFHNTDTEDQDYIPLPTVEAFLTDKMQILPAKIREVVNRFLKELQWRSNNHPDEDYDHFYAGTSIADDYQGRAELIHRRIDRSGQEGNIHSPQRDFSDVISLFKGMSENEIFNILRTNMDPDPTQDSPVDMLDGEPFWQFLREKTRNERDDTYIDSSYFYKHAALTVDYYKKGSKDPMLKSILGTTVDDSASEFAFVFSKAGDELRAFVINKQHPENIQLINIDFKHFQDFDILTEEMGIKTLDDEAYHHINAAFVSGIKEAYQLNPKDPDIGKTALSLAKEKLLGPTGVTLHLNRNFNVSDKHFKRVITMLEKNISLLSEDLKSVNEKKYYDLHYFEDVAETRGQVADSILLKRLKNQIDYLTEKLNMIQTSVNAILAHQEAINKLLQRPDYRSNPDTHSEISRLENEIQSLVENPSVWNMHLPYVFYGSKTKDLTQERVENFFHIKMVGFYAVTQSFTLNSGQSIEDTEKTLEESLIHSDHVLENSKSLGQHNVILDDPHLHTSSTPTPLSLSSPLNENFLESQYGKKILQTLQEVLSNRYGSMFPDAKSKDLGLLKRAMIKFLHSTKPIEDGSVFTPYLGRVLHPVTIAREWQKIYPSFPFSVKDNAKAYAAYQAIEDAIQTAYHQVYLHSRSHLPRVAA